MRNAVWLVLLVSISACGFGQTIYWKKDHIYNGPGGTEIAVVMPQPTDTIAPGVPTSLSTTSATATSVALSWTGSSDTGGSGLAGYKVYRQQGTGASLPVGTVGAGVTSFTDQPLTPSTSYSYRVVAFDNAENHSAFSSSIGATTLSASTDTIAPSIPTNLTGLGLSSTSIQLQWNASTDVGGSGVASYKVYRNSSLIGTSRTNGYTDSTGLSSNTAYSYTVAAVDGATNVSSQSAPASVSTTRPLVFTDNFNRSDSPDSLNSWNWLGQAGGGHWGISAGMANLPASTSTNYGAGWWTAVTATSQTHFKATVFVMLPATTYLTGAGVSFWGRYRAYISTYTSSVSYLRLSYFDLYNNETILSSATLNGSGSWTLAVQADDSTRIMKVFVNGVQQISYTETDTTRPNSGNIGITGYANSFDLYLDNFTLEQ